VSTRNVSFWTKAAIKIAEDEPEKRPLYPREAAISLLNS
jgi:hypothetical protein